MTSTSNNLFKFNYNPYKVPPLSENMIVNSSFEKSVSGAIAMNEWKCSSTDKCGIKKYSELKMQPIEGQNCAYIEGNNYIQYGKINDDYNINAENGPSYNASLRSKNYKYVLTFVVIPGDSTKVNGTAQLLTSNDDGTNPQVILTLDFINFGRIIAEYFVNDNNPNIGKSINIKIINNGTQKIYIDNVGFYEVPASSLQNGYFDSPNISGTVSNTITGWETINAGLVKRSSLGLGNINNHSQIAFIDKDGSMKIDNKNTETKNIGVFSEGYKYILGFNIIKKNQTDIISGSVSFLSTKCSGWRQNIDRVCTPSVIKTINFNTSGFIQLEHLTDSTSLYSYIGLQLNNTGNTKFYIEYVLLTEVYGENIYKPFSFNISTDSNVNINGDSNTMTLDLNNTNISNIPLLLNDTINMLKIQNSNYDITYKIEGNELIITTTQKNAFTNVENFESSTPLATTTSNSFNNVNKIIIKSNTNFTDSDKQEINTLVTYFKDNLDKYKTDRLIGINVVDNTNDTSGSNDTHTTNNNTTLITIFLLLILMAILLFLLILNKN
jgi:hypothetical protein